MIIKLNKEHKDLVNSHFGSIYLAELNNFHAYGDISEGELKSYVSYYISDEEPAWYLTSHFGDYATVLQNVIERNELQGRLKFYSFSKYQIDRYNSVDEFRVPAKFKCFYTNHWEVMYDRALISEDTVMRCNYLKQEYRTVLPQGGNL